MSTGAKIAAGFALGMVIIVAIGVSAYVSTQRLLEANRWVTHTHEVLERLEDVLSALTDAETGQRGFILTGDEQYLGPYQAATGRIQQDLAALAALMRDPAAQEGLEQVRKLSDAKLAHVRETVQLRRESGQSAATAAVRAGRGKKIMDDLRAVIATTKARERQLLDERNAAADAAARRTIFTVALWMPLALIVLAIMAVIILRTARFGGPGIPGGKWGGTALRYAFAVLAVAVAVVLRWRLVESFGPLPIFVTFYPAVLLVASIAGGGPGIVTAVLAALAAAYWFIEPIGSFYIEAPNDVLAVGIFTGANLFLCILAERLRRSRWAEAVTVAQERQVEELSLLNEELSQQSEELSRQAEELSEQSEELSRQNEELQAQSEEIQGLNAELGRREELLETLLAATRLAGSEQAAMRDVCAAGLNMFGPAASLVIVCEKQGTPHAPREEAVTRSVTSTGLRVRAAAGRGEDTVPQWLSPGPCFAELVIAEGRTACLNDAALRPDLSLLQLPGQAPFRAALCAPMYHAGRAFGAVAVYNFQPQEWTAEQFRLAEWLAAQATRILETLRVQEDLRRQAALIDLSPDGIVVRRVDGTIILWGHGAELLYGWTKEEAIGKTTHSLLKTRFPQPLDEINRQLEEHGRWSGELVHATKDGREVVVESRWLAQRDATGQIVELLESNVDVTERKRAEREREVTVEFLHLANEARSTRELVQAAAEFFQRHSGCEAVGIRLREGEDYPYFEARGFPQHFIVLENSLCSRDAAGQIVRDSVGYPIMECMCGNVIQGRLDPSQPFFTPHGSFWTNSTTELLATSSEADRQARTRNRCNGEGYESVALVPLIAGAERIGLVQLNDRQKGKFSRESIALWERLAGYLAVAVAKLRAEEEATRLASFPLLNPNPIVETDLEGRVLFVNPSAQRLFPDIAERGPDHPWLAGWEAVTRACRAGGGDLPAREMAVGDRCYHQALYYVPQTGRIRAYGLDITGRVRAEEALRESEARRKVAEAVQVERERFNHVLDMLPAYVILLSPDYHVPFANRFFEDRFGKSEGRRCYEYLFQRSEPCENCETYKVLATGAPHRWEWTGPDGRDYDIYDFPFTDVDGAPMIMEVGLDITERKQAEAAIRAANETLEQRVAERTTALADTVAELRRSNHELEQFAYITSHDLQEPLRQVRAFAQLLRDRCQDALDAKAGQYLQFVYDGAARMSELVQDLLAYSRVGARVSTPQPVACAEALATALANLQASIAETGAKVTHDDLPTVAADSTQLVLLFQNLVGNAVKFHRDGAAPQVHVAARRDGGGWVFSVRDNGIGIAPEHHERVFLIFQRLHDREKYAGTGIGLAICKKIVEQYGGRLWIESQVGQGSTFYFSIPEEQA